MSFSITVKAQNGRLTADPSGDVPDGEYQVNGHEDTEQRSLGVVRRSPDGRYVQQASAVHHKET